MAKKDFRFGISSDLKGVDLNMLLAENAASSFFMEIAEDMPELELRAKDVVVVDKSLQPKKVDLVVMSSQTEAELRVMTWKEAQAESDITLWGVVTSVIRKFQR